MNFECIILILTRSEWLNYEGRRSTWPSRRYIEGAFGSRHTTTNQLKTAPDILYLTNRFHFAVVCSVIDSQMTLQRGEVGY